MEDLEKAMKWYMVSTVSGKEEKVIETLKNKIETENMQDYFKNIKMFKVPHLTSRELEKKTKGDEYTAKFINLYKGYIFIEMLMSDNAWFLVRNTQYVTGLVGSSGKGAKPTPISNRKIREMEAKEKELIENFDIGNIETAFKESTIVRVKSGLFENQVGTIVKNNDITQKAFVEIEVFGRKTPTEFSYDQLEIIG
ncbi:transcription termination/antitermination protein NusG [[Mycoplasma] gypis]|uniref:Transcription termination/antitermination protein NusG n=1 Tax=[Mycoplasma] gypis TaxID=92404 RepID=A0ABZ2RMH9_9BACT|nr:transcription termination/antitermination protein NusG [[Mycoplasma] gypis]MBN0919084.1 transcription termination/antitermination protein NusG [[Mycoplasma] gypis]